MQRPWTSVPFPAKAVSLLIQSITGTLSFFPFKVALCASTFAYSCKRVRVLYWHALRTFKEPGQTIVLPQTY
ncbi:MAG: hypothetical protein BYD32DRAFT_405766 [Podila humilis]|nr:MAG: hypothetical protein BYD32DRAFT_405766 [Podila humilis]